MDKANAWRGKQARTKALGHMFNAIEMLIKIVKSNEPEKDILELTNRRLQDEHVTISREYTWLLENTRLAAFRKFQYQGVEELATWHLKYGADPQKSIRVYFHRTEDGKLLITHISHHLPTMSSKKDGSQR